MKTYFVNTSCPKCGHSYDPTYPKCPYCNENNNDRGCLFFENFIHTPIWKQALFFALSIIGLSLIASFVELIQSGIFSLNNPNSPIEDVQRYLLSIEGASIRVFTSYALLFGFMAALFIGSYKEFIKQASFKKFFLGVGFFGLLLAFNYIYGIISNLLFSAAGIDPSVNGNESSIRAISKAYPLFAIIIFGILGPMTEELGYRVGLFSLISRLGKVLGYILSALVFAFIHFDWTCFSSSQATIIELINIPSYIVAGLLLCIAYKKAGLLGSYTAHALNNLLSVILIILTTTTSI